MTFRGKADAGINAEGNVSLLRCLPYKTERRFVPPGGVTLQSQSADPSDVLFQESFRGQGGVSGL